MKYYKWTADQKPLYGKGKYRLNGGWQPRIEGDLVQCDHGYHLCREDQLSEYMGTELYEVEPKDIEIEGSDKVVCRNFRVIRQLPWSREDMIDFAQRCAKRAKKHAETAKADAAAWAAADARAAAWAARVADAWAAAVRDTAYAAWAARAADAAADAAHDAAAARAAAHGAAWAAAWDARVADAWAAADAERKLQRRWIQRRIKRNQETE